jgi:hypothetical protein
MKWYFESRPDNDGAGRDEDGSLPGLISLSAAVLQRQGGRVLDPGKAEAIAQPRNAAGEAPPPPRPTVYRARTLLVPGDLLRNDSFITAINRILEMVGMMVVAPTVAADPDLDTDAVITRGDPEVLRRLRELPRPAVLAPREDNPVPVSVDAWIAVQTLRAAAGPGEKQPDPRLVEDLDEVTISRIPEISLEHLLVGSPITGSPISNGGGAIPPGTSSGDGSGPTITDSYLFSGGDPRTPVMLLLDPPERKSTDYCAEKFGRRPVVAVFDSGVARHWWLEGDPNDPGGVYAASAGGFVAIDPQIQDAIRTESEHARAHGDKPRQVIMSAWDTPDADNPLIGELNEAKGHGTFIAGIVRQVAPDARVLAVRVMHSDNVCNEGDAICGLRHLAKRIALGGDDLAATVDVISLSWGFFSESRHDMVVTTGLWKVIKILLDLGVVVAAAAGNFAMSQEFYPAAFARETEGTGQVPVLSVGALNPNGTKASFSNDGDWVVAWAMGAAVISTYPVDADGSRSPELRIPGNRKPAGELPPGREALDPNDFSGGFSQWSGTSFSAPYLAALIARSLMEGGGDLPLSVAGKQAAADRVVAALDYLHQEESKLRGEELGKASHDG